MKVLLDNGHGENTPGKRSPKWSDGSQLFEWEYAREIAKGVYNQLRAKGIDAELLVKKYRRTFGRKSQKSKRDSSPIR